MSDPREALAVIVALADEDAAPADLVRAMTDVAASALRLTVIAEAPADTMPKASGSAVAWRDWSGIAEADRAARAPIPYVSADGTSGYYIREGDVTVSAVPYRWAGMDRWQVYVGCGCPSGMHAFPADSLDEGLDRGLAICQAMARHHVAKSATIRS
jgi:hypothetical protein